MLYLAYVLTDPELANTTHVHKRKSSTYSVEYDPEMGAIYGFDTPLAGSVLSLTPGKRTNLISAHRAIKQLTNIPLNSEQQRQPQTGSYCQQVVV